MSDLHIKGSTRDILDMLQKAEIIEEAVKSKPHFDWSKINWKEDLKTDSNLRNQDSLSAQAYAKLSESDKSSIAIQETVAAIRNMSQTLVDSERPEAQKKGIACAEKLGFCGQEIAKLNESYTRLLTQYDEIKKRFKDIKKLDGELFLSKQRTLNEKLATDQKTLEDRRKDLMKTLGEKTTSFINEAKDNLTKRETLISNLNQIYQDGLTDVDESKRAELLKAPTITTPPRRLG
jgi:regulator of replication initiation timing